MNKILQTPMKWSLLTIQMKKGIFLEENNIIVVENT